MILIADASAAVRVALGQDHDGRLIASLGAASAVWAPDLFPAEVSSALWKSARFGGVGVDAVLSSLRLALDLPDRLLPCIELAPEVVVLAVEQGRPVYDLFYLVAARRHAAVLLTCDAGLARLATQLGVRVA